MITKLYKLIFTSILLFAVIIASCQKPMDETNVIASDNIESIFISSDLFPEDTLQYLFDCDGIIMEKIKFENGNLVSHQTRENKKNSYVNTIKNYEKGSDKIKTLTTIEYQYGILAKRESTNFANDTTMTKSYYDEYGNIDMLVTQKKGTPISITTKSNQYDNMPALSDENKMSLSYKNEKELLKSEALNNNECKIDTNGIVENYYSGDTLFTKRTISSAKEISFELDHDNRNYQEALIDFGKYKMREIEITTPDSFISIVTTYTLDSLKSWKQADKLTYIETIDRKQQFRNENDFECCSLNNSTFKYEFDSKGNWIKRIRYDSEGKFDYNTYRKINYCN